MEHLLGQNERENLQNTFRTHPILLTCYRVFTPRMARLNGLEATEADVFCETAWLLDYLLARPDISQHQVDSLWVMLVNRIRRWKPDVTDNDKLLVASTVFLIVRVTLTQHFESIYREGICSLLNHTLERETESRPGEEQAVFLQRLTDQIPLLCEWINGYDEAGEWLSDEIADTLSATDIENGKDDFKPSGTTFTKTSLLNDKLIDIMGMRLARANKLDASPDIFRKLFSGINQQFTMTWSGKGGELRDLFKMLTDDGYAEPKRGYQQILKSHFLNRDGRRFLNIHGDKSIPSFQPVIDDCAFLLQHLTDNMTAIMKQLISENESVLREMGYFDLQAAKQSGLSIRKKRR